MTKFIHTVSIVMVIAQLLTISIAEEYTFDPGNVIFSYKDKVESETDALIDTVVFLARFSECARSMNTGHNPIPTNAEYIDAPDGLYSKAIYNGCEILTVHFVHNEDDVQDIRCSWQMTKDAALYVDDFMILFLETLYACGVEVSDASEIFLKAGSDIAQDSNCSGEVTVNDIHITYKATNNLGVTFTITRA